MANNEKEEAIRLYRAGMAAADLEQLEEALRNFRSEPEVPVIGDRFCRLFALFAHDSGRIRALHSAEQVLT